MKKLILILATLSLPAFANAAPQWGAFGGINMTELDSNGTSNDSEMGLEVGAQAIVDMGWPVKLRTGAGYVQKNSSSVGGGDLNLGYIEVPVTALYAFNGMASIFGGLNLDLNVQDDDNSTIESFTTNLVFGGRFNISGPSHVEAMYEMGMTEVAPDVEIGSSLGVRYVHMF